MKIYRIKTTDRHAHSLISATRSLPASNSLCPVLLKDTFKRELRASEYKAGSAITIYVIPELLANYQLFVWRLSNKPAKCWPLDASPTFALVH